MLSGNSVSQRSLAMKMLLQRMILRQNSKAQKRRCLLLIMLMKKGIITRQHLILKNRRVWKYLRLQFMFEESFSSGGVTRNIGSVTLRCQKRIFWKLLKSVLTYYLQKNVQWSNLVNCSGKECCLCMTFLSAFQKRRLGMNNVSHVRKCGWIDWWHSCHNYEACDECFRLLSAETKVESRSSGSVQWKLDILIRWWGLPCLCSL